MQYLIPFMMLPHVQPVSSMPKTHYRLQVVYKCQSPCRDTAKLQTVMSAAHNDPMCHLSPDGFVDLCQSQLPGRSLATDRHRIMAQVGATISFP